MKITVRKLSKSFGSIPVLRDVSLEIEPGELFFLLGPSGCGKTTLLRIVAGFEAPGGGDLLFDGRFVNPLPPHLRNVGMVFQNYALWPHLTVSQNVGYGLEVQKVEPGERRRRVDEVLEWVRMGGLGDRLPGQLSGGQQQRVALARALVIRPGVLLLDEPLSNLDARLRLELRDEIRRIQEATRITTVYVTHDQREALSLAGRMAVMDRGAISQVGTPRDVYCRPSNRCVAEFLGDVNWIDAVVESQGPEVMVLSTPQGPLEAAPRHELSPGTAVSAGFRPESVRWVSALDSGWDCSILRSLYQGDFEEYHLQSGFGTVFKALVSNPSLRPRTGGSHRVSVRPQDVFVVPR